MKKKRKKPKKKLRKKLKLRKIFSIFSLTYLPPIESFWFFLGQKLLNKNKKKNKNKRQLKNKKDQYEVNAARKPLMQKVRIALSNGLAETALDLLLKGLQTDSANLMDKNNAREGSPLTLIVELLLGLGRLDEGL